MKKSRIFLFGDTMIFGMIVCGLSMLGGIVCLCMQISLKNNVRFILGLIFFVVGAIGIPCSYFGCYGEYILKEDDEITLYRMPRRKRKSFLLKELYEIRIRSLAGGKYFSGKYICLYFSEASMLKSGITDDFTDVQQKDGVLLILYAQKHIMWLRAMLGEEVWTEKYKGI